MGAAPPQGCSGREACSRRLTNNNRLAACDAQVELEAKALGFLRRLQRRTGAKNVCLVGGVVQNSVLNGRIAREAGFEQVCPGPCPYP